MKERQRTKGGYQCLLILVHRREKRSGITLGEIDLALDVLVDS